MAIPELINAKEKLDSLIRKQRVALYKPIQIAEILYQVRVGELSVDDIRQNLELYRNPSKRWRDVVSRQLINQVSTSSQRYQDNLFDANAMPPEVIAILSEHNLKFNGVVERYIYQQFHKRQEVILNLIKLLDLTEPESFQLSEFLSVFTVETGIRRSIDKAYECVVYALFSTLVKHLQINVTIESNIAKYDLLKEFEDFTRVLVGIDSKNTSIAIPAKLYRLGVANAADRGLDIWSNFGPAVQVKHLSLTDDLADDIAESVTADRIVIVCVDGEEDTINRILNQLSISERIQGIVTQNDLIWWYDRALRGQFGNILGGDLLSSLRIEFRNEFPFSVTFKEFYCGRGYHRIKQLKKKPSIFWEGGGMSSDC